MRGANVFYLYTNMYVYLYTGWMYLYSHPYAAHIYLCLYVTIMERTYVLFLRHEMGSTIGLELKHELGHGLRHRNYSFIRFVIMSSFLHRVSFHL